MNDEVTNRTFKKGMEEKNIIIIKEGYEAK